MAIVGGATGSRPQLSECPVGVGDSLRVDIAGGSPVGDLLPVGLGEHPLDRYLGGPHPRLDAWAEGARQRLLDDGGHAAHAYGTDALILIRPDGYIGLTADPAETEEAVVYLRSL